MLADPGSSPSQVITVAPFGEAGPRDVRNLHHFAACIPPNAKWHKIFSSAPSSAVVMQTACDID